MVIGNGPLTGTVAVVVMLTVGAPARDSISWLDATMTACWHTRADDRGAESRDHTVSDRVH